MKQVDHSSLAGVIWLVCNRQSVCTLPINSKLEESHLSPMPLLLLSSVVFFVAVVIGVASAPRRVMLRYALAFSTIAMADCCKHACSCYSSARTVRDILFSFLDGGASRALTHLIPPLACRASTLLIKCTNAGASCSLQYHHACVACSFQVADLNHHVRPP